MGRHRIKHLVTRLNKAHMEKTPIHTLTHKSTMQSNHGAMLSWLLTEWVTQWRRSHVGLAAGHISSMRHALFPSSLPDLAHTPHISINPIKYHNP